MSNTLDVEVRAELDRRRGDWQQIAVAAGVSHSWISQFVRHKIHNPGYVTLKRLYAVLLPEGDVTPAAQIAGATHTPPTGAAHAA